MLSSLPGAIPTALAGLQDAAGRSQDRAERIARTTAVTPPEDGQPLDPVEFDDTLVNDVAGLALDRAQFKANIAVLNSASDMERQLLDMIA